MSDLETTAAVVQDKPKDFIHNFETDLYCDLTKDEVRERGESLAKILEDIRLEKEELKDLTKQRKQKMLLMEGRAKMLGDATRFHRELRQVRVDVMTAETGMVNEVRTDTGEIIRHRKITEKEAQMTVPTVAEAAERKKGRAPK